MPHVASDRVLHKWLRSALGRARLGKVCNRSSARADLAHDAAGRNAQRAVSQLPLPAVLRAEFQLTETVIYLALALAPTGAASGGPPAACPDPGARRLPGGPPLSGPPGARRHRTLATANRLLDPVTGLRTGRYRMPSSASSSGTS